MSQTNLFTDPKYTPRPQAELEAEAADMLEENVEKVRAIYQDLREAYNCLVGYDYAPLARMIGTSEAYVKAHADTFAKRLRLENDGEALIIPDPSLADPEDRLAEAIWHGTVDGEAFDGDPADLW